MTSPFTFKDSCAAVTCYIWWCYWLTHWDQSGLNVSKCHNPGWLPFGVFRPMNFILRSRVTDDF